MSLSNSSEEQLNIIWEALHGFRESCIPEGVDEAYDNQWDDICTAMAFIKEDLEKFNNEVSHE